MVTPMGTLKLRPSAARVEVAVLTQDDDTHLVPRTRTERCKDLVLGWIQRASLHVLQIQEGDDLGEIGLLEFSL